jgi:hypothetical protein
VTDEPDTGLGLLLDDTPHSADLEREARLRHAAHRVERELYAQSLRPHEERSPELVNFLLDMRATLNPAPADSEVLRELPLLQLRFAVGGPGRAS